MHSLTPKAALGELVLIAWHFTANHLYLNKSGEIHQPR